MFIEQKYVGVIRERVDITFLERENRWNAAMLLFNMQYDMLFMLRDYG